MKKENRIRDAVIVLLVLIFSTPTILFSQTEERVIPENAKSMSNPLKDSMQFLPEAKTIYKSKCTPCHGKKGKGDGPSAYTCDPKPADHSSDFVQNRTDGELFWLISNGHTQTPMVSFKKTVNANERWKLILYIRSLAAKKS